MADAPGAVYVRSLDCSMHHGQVDDEDLLSPSIMETTGWIARDHVEYVVIARDISPDPTSDRWRSTLAVPRSANLNYAASRDQSMTATRAGGDE